MVVIEGFEVRRKAWWRTLDGRVMLSKTPDGEWLIMACNTTDSIRLWAAGIGESARFRTRYEAGLVASEILGCDVRTKLPEPQYLLRLDGVEFGRLRREKGEWRVHAYGQSGSVATGTTRAEALRGARIQRDLRAMSADERG